MLIKRGPESYRMLLEVLSAGRVAVMACDTIYGFVGAVPQSEDRIRAIKGRGETKPFLRLIPHASWLETLDVCVPHAPILNLWPGPYTFVMNLKSGGSAAFRVPQERRLASLLEEAGVSVFSTSVNRAGEKPLNNPAAIFREFGSEVALVEDSGVYEGRRPSTVVDLTCSPFRIVRNGEGVVPARLLEAGPLAGRKF